MRFRVRHRVHAELKLLSWQSRLHDRRCQLAFCGLTLYLAIMTFGVTVAPLEGEQDEPTADQLEFFEKRIRPFLAHECYECHAAKKQEGGLRVDYRAGLLRGGDSGAAVMPGDAENSLLIQSIAHKHPEYQMPKLRPKLPDAVIADFVKWVNQGMPDPRGSPPADTESIDPDWESVFNARKSLWSLQPVRAADRPTVLDAGWPKHPADQFILFKLDERGIRPAPPSSAATWLRRVHFAITGLPPTAEQLADFVDDRLPDTYERLIDQTLASVRYGEHWARHWMDLVRYAESYGHEQDYDIPHAWQYRDYLIRAFNADVPYSQFVEEHIAGDLLENPRRNLATGFNESIIATGFWFLHQATHAPVDPLQDEADRIDNQIDVFSKTFLGLTVACARCHDHKFDAISTRDYYSLTAFLRASRQQIALLDPDGTLETKIAEIKHEHQQFNSQVKAVVQERLKQGSLSIAAYLLAAREALTGPAKATDKNASTPPDIIFENFEHETYGQWVVEGDAFGTEPATGRHPGQQAVEGFEGKRLANSFTRGDAPQGALRSPSFRIERSYIRFLLGGGTPSQKARFVLKIGGKELRTAAGRNNELLEPMVWNVHEFLGSEARLEIIDDDSTIWGHINVDEIVFSDSPLGNRLSRPVEIVAAERGLNPVILERWVQELMSKDTQLPSHPLHSWFVIAGRSDSDGKSSSPLVSDSAREKELVAANYKQFPASDFSDWFCSGQAFLERDYRVAGWRIVGNKLAYFPSGMAHSGWIADELQGVLRSPTFTLTHDNIHLHYAGSGTQIRLIIARYGLREFNPLLFGETLFDVNTDGRFQWKTLSTDIRRYRGMPAYFELIDSGNGHIALDRIVFSDFPQPPSDELERSPQPTTDTLLEHAQRLDELLRNGLECSLGESSDANAEQFLWWLSGKLLLDWGNLPLLDSLPDAQLLTQRLPSSTKLPQPMPVLAMADGSVEPTYIFVRGEPKQPGDRVERRYLEAIRDRDSMTVVRGSGRRELAASVTASTNPLLDRVWVNRVWGRLFGRGIVSTVDNFGALGRPPTHPELLDHLAATFREGGESTKALVRSLCLTQTWQMSSTHVDKDLESRDPDNEYFHRQGMRRLEAESIRDNLLAVSGQLDRTSFGRSVPTYLSPFMGDPFWLNSRGIKSGPMDGESRRSIYLQIRRNFLAPLMLAYDMALPDTTVGRRNVSNIPGQALALMNDPFVQQQADSFAEQLLRTNGVSIEDRIEQMFVQALGRYPRLDELQQMQSFLKTQAEGYGLGLHDGEQDIRVWADACHIMFMLKEFIYVP